MNWKGWNWKRWVWPGVLILSTLAVSLAAFQNWQSPLRPLITLWFMAVCPGMALLRVFGFRLAAAGWTLAIAFSLAIDTTVGIALLYSGRWSWQAGLVILAAITIIPTLFEPFLKRIEGPQPLIVVTKVPAHPRKPRSAAKSE
ncbi:MAG: hypothetical protein D9V45_10130 [Chloroflexi bacterium]|nr:MAG: hypothetical protein D9V45_10130 [Chloroflexota bacterium]